MSNANTPGSAYEKLNQAFKEIHYLKEIASLLGWDQEVMMPKGGASQRAEQTAYLKKVIHEKITAPQIGDYLDTLSETDGNTFSAPQLADIREAKRTYTRATAVPSDLVEEIARLEVKSAQTWMQARKDNDFESFAPLLQETVEKRKAYADCIRGEKSRYEALLDEYEPGESEEDLKILFEDLRDGMAPILEKIRASSTQPSTQHLRGNFPIEKQKLFNKALIQQLGYNTEEGRLDTSTHPFCSGSGGDVRITTRYEHEDLTGALFGTIHETGHALYEQGINRERIAYPAGGFASLGLHESQSRLWENQVARSLPFWKHFYPKLQDTFPQTFSKMPLEQFWKNINQVTPSLIRTEADEITYNYHIIIRFELESALIRGDLFVQELPEAWNNKYKHYLGVTPEDYATGCLQDIHWAAGFLGYFPTYTLGNLYSSQFFAQIKLEISDLDEQIANGEFKQLREWLRTKLHHHGHTYSAKELCKRTTKQNLSTKPFLSYIQDKYYDIYNI